VTNVMSDERSIMMADKTDPRVNARPLEDTLADTGQGIPDEAIAPGEELQRPPSDEEVADIARKLDAPVPDGKKPR